MTAPDRERVYLDVLIADPLATQNVPAIYNQTYNIPIIKKCSDWQMSVVRFSCPINAIPLFEFQIERGPLQTDINLGAYSVTLVRGATIMQTKLIFDPEVRNVNPLPNPPSSNPPLYIQDQSTDYYGVYTVQHMLDMFNAAFITAHAGLPVVPGSAPPHFEYDPATAIITLVAQQANYDVNVPGYTEIWVNNASFRFFQSMPAQRWGIGLPAGRDNQLIVNSHYNNIVGADLRISQNNATLSDWNDLTSIVLGGLSLPTRAEFTPNGGGITTIASQAPSQVIMTDFIPIPPENLNQRGTVIYNPTAEYRWLNLISDSELRTFNITVNWTDRYQNIHLIKFRPDEQLSIKILFQKCRSVH